MRFDVYGLSFQTPEVTFYLWSPWRASALEHRLFDAIRQLPGLEMEEEADEWRIRITDQRAVRTALQSAERVLKGWQEDADPGSERRTWYWMFEADIDSNGYDHTGTRGSMWAFLRVSLERGGLGEPEKLEHVDLDGFGFEVHPSRPE